MALGGAFAQAIHFLHAHEQGGLRMGEHRAASQLRDVAHLHTHEAEHRAV